MHNDGLEEFSQLLDSLDVADKRQLLYKLVELAYEGEAHVLVDVPPTLALKMASVSNITVLGEIQQLVKHLETLTSTEDYGSAMFRDLMIFSAVWYAGKCQGIREERAHHKTAA